MLIPDNSQSKYKTCLKMLALSDNINNVVHEIEKLGQCCKSMKEGLIVIQNSMVQ